MGWKRLSGSCQKGPASDLIARIDAEPGPLLRQWQPELETYQRLSLGLIAYLSRIVLLAVILTACGSVASVQAHEGHNKSHAAMHDHSRHLGIAAGGVPAAATIRASSTHHGCPDGMPGCPSCYVGAACCSPAIIGDATGVVRPDDRGRRITFAEPPILSGREPERPAKPPRPFGA